MPTDSEHAPAPASAKHETVDANVRSLVHWGIGVFCLLGAGLLVSVLVFRYFVTHQGLGPPASPFSESRALPPAPVLQVTPGADLSHYLSRQSEALDTYGWVDKKAGIVRIPIDRAMQLLLQKGSLASKTPGAAPPGGAKGATSASPSRGPGTGMKSNVRSLPPHLTGEGN